MEICPIIYKICFTETSGKKKAKDLVLPPVTVSQQAGKQAAIQALSTSLDLVLAEVGSKRSEKENQKQYFRRTLEPWCFSLLSV